MALAVVVTWPNAGTPLLPESGTNVVLEADGAELSPTSTLTGSRRFGVPDGAATVRLKAGFTASFRCRQRPDPGGGWPPGRPPAERRRSDHRTVLSRVGADTTRGSHRERLSRRIRLP
jgi:hypothetical protein